MEQSNEQRDYIEELTENVLRTTAHEYRRKFQSMRYGYSRLWVVSRDGEKVAKTNPTAHNPNLCIALWKKMNPMVVEFLLDEGNARSDRPLGRITIEDNTRLGIAKDVVEKFLQKKWSPKAMEDLVEFIKKS